MKASLLSLYQRFAARRMFSRWSPDYEQDVGDNFYSAANAVASETVKRLTNHPLPDILDVGIGTGLLSGAIKDALPCNITGLDFSDDMMAVSAMKGIASMLIKCDAGKDRWPLADESFNAVISAGLTEYLTPDMVQHYLRETLRLLKPSGWMIFTYIPAEKTNQRYWNGKTGGYLCCSYQPEELIAQIKSQGFDVIDHGAAFAGCIFQDGSHYEYRLITTRKKD